MICEVCGGRINPKSEFVTIKRAAEFVPMGFSPKKTGGTFYRHQKCDKERKKEEEEFFSSLENHDRQASA